MYVYILHASSVHYWVYCPYKYKNTLQPLELHCSPCVSALLVHLPCFDGDAVLSMGLPISFSFPFLFLFLFAFLCSFLFLSLFESVSYWCLSDQFPGSGCLLFLPQSCTRSRWGLPSCFVSRVLSSLCTSHTHLGVCILYMLVHRIVAVVTPACKAGSLCCDPYLSFCSIFAVIISWKMIDFSIIYFVRFSRSWTFHAHLFSNLWSLFSWCICIFPFFPSSFFLLTNSTFPPFLAWLPQPLPSSFYSSILSSSFYHFDRFLPPLATILRPSFCADRPPVRVPCQRCIFTVLGVVRREHASHKHAHADLHFSMALVMPNGPEVDTDSPVMRFLSYPSNSIVVFEIQDARNLQIRR